jgi:hypothetical protein
MLIHYCFKLLMYGFIQNLLVDWIKLNRLPSKSQVLLNQIAIKMVSLRVPATALLILEWLLTDHPLKIVGDSGPTERQVSPEKLYRAALLKNRFADTILKAREKTLPQVGYGFSFPCFCISIVRALPNLDVTGYNLIWLRSG